MSKRLRRSGSPWRILVHEYLGKKDGEPSYGHSHHIGNQPGSRPDGEWRTNHTLAGTEFDELVIGQWIHVEQMDVSEWAVHVGGVRIGVTADRDGRPRAVNVYGPGDWLDPVPGVRYSCEWRLEESEESAIEEILAAHLEWVTAGRPGEVSQAEARKMLVDDPGQVLRILPERWHEEFLGEYQAALDLDREHRKAMLHRWHLRALAYSSPHFEASAREARDARPEDLFPVPGLEEWKEVSGDPDN